MGQYWKLINIDRQECLDGVGGKWAEFGFSTTLDDIAILASGNAWAGDRIMVLGEYSYLFPPGILTEGEEEESSQNMLRWTEVYEKDFNWSIEDGKNTTVVRNFNSREYITDRLFPYSKERHHRLHHPDIAQALLSKISWSTDPGMAMHWHPNWHRGPWAGARIDIALLSDIDDLGEWKDITEETFRDVWKVTLRDGWTIEKDCKCNLCNMYHQMCIDEKDENSRKEDEDARNIQSSRHDTKPTDEQAKGMNRLVELHKDRTVADNSKFHHSDKSLSPFERLPYEITDLIFFQVPRSSLASCALTSTRMNSAVGRALYATVTLDSPLPTRRFAKALTRRPFLCDHVRSLTAAVKPHWSFVRILLEILKQLPRLVSLHILPSWITYGDLPYWEYPFKLRTIKWGLIKDKASQKFITSHSKTLEEVSYMKLDTELWFGRSRIVTIYDSVGLPTYKENSDEDEP
ncbi:hypothetical protein CPB86DRAFT_871196 [Serendipita vermifera]|nr:hypothetical protein CPB86DRAFT_871196 [Serendipita vermifera]